MADVVVPATRRTRGATAVAAAPIAVFQVPAVIPRTHSATGVPSTLVAAGAILVSVSACMSTTLAYYATFSVSLVCFARALSPERVGGFLCALDASLRETAPPAERGAKPPRARARRRLSRRMRAPRPRGRRGRRRRPEEVGGSQVERAQGRGAGGVVLAPPDRLRDLPGRHRADQRGLRGSQDPSPVGAGLPQRRDQGDQVAVAQERRGGGGTLRLQVQGHVMSHRDRRLPPVQHGHARPHLRHRCNHRNAIQCRVLRGMCSFALLVADWVYPPDDPDETGTAGDRLNTTNTSRPAGNSGEARRSADLEVRESWNYLWLLIIVAYFVDVCLLRVTVGPRPVAVAFLALCGIEIINVGKKVHHAPDDGEGTGGSADAVNGRRIDKWRRAAMAVLAASSAKVLAIGVLLDAHLAVLSFVSLCAMTVLLLVREESLSELEASGEDKDGEEGAGIAGDDTGGAEEGADEVRAEHSNGSAEDAEAGSVLEEHCDSSEEQVDEQRQEEPDHSSGSTMDGWDFVEVDPDMPIKDNCREQRLDYALVTDRLGTRFFLRYV